MSPGGTELGNYQVKKTKNCTREGHNTLVAERSLVERSGTEGGLGGTVGAPSKNDWVMVGRWIRKYEYKIEKLRL